MMRHWHRVRPGTDPRPTASLTRTASWVVVAPATDRVVGEVTRLWLVVELAGRGYRVVPILRWLADLNKEGARGCAHFPVDRGRGREPACGGRA